MTPRSALIEKSIGCCNAGLASLVPLVGLVAAAVALNRFRFVVVETNDRWNPGRFRLYLGAILALLGLLLHGLAGLFLFLKILRGYGDV